MKSLTDTVNFSSERIIESVRSTLKNRMHVCVGTQTCSPLETSNNNSASDQAVPIPPTIAECTTNRGDLYADITLPTTALCDSNQMHHEATSHVEALSSQGKNPPHERKPPCKCNDSMPSINQITPVEKLCTNGELGSATKSIAVCGRWNLFLCLVI